MTVRSAERSKHYYISKLSVLFRAPNSVVFRGNCGADKHSPNILVLVHGVFALWFILYLQLVFILNASGQ